MGRGNRHRVFDAEACSLKSFSSAWLIHFQNRPSRGPTHTTVVTAFGAGVVQLCMHNLRRELMTDTLSTADFVDRVDTMGAGDLDRLQDAIDRRRKRLAGEVMLAAAGPSSTVIERRAYGSGVLQLEKRGESGPYWYFHHRKDGKQKSVYLGKTDAPEIKLAQLKGGIGG
jgi:hypothetical protein